MTIGNENDRFRILENRNTVSPSDALDILRQAVLERLIEFEKLPKQIRIDSVIPFMPEALDDRFEDEPISLGIGDVLDELASMHESYGNEFSCAIVADYKGNLSLGSYIEGDENSVSVVAPLKRREYTSPLGLTVYREDTIIADCHSHGPDHPYSFTLEDIYGYFRHGKKDSAQMFVVRENGVIDMIQFTAQSQLISEESFCRLSGLWGTYLDTRGGLRENMTPQEYHEFLTRIFGDILKLGFYSNEESDDRALLELKNR